jgi:RHS repeat-associated protein
VQERYCYSGYGLIGVLDSSFASRSASAYDWETFFGGYQYNADLGLYTVRFRVYHPVLGAWVSRDPLGIQSDVNVYRYVWNQPLRILDVNGLAGFTWRGCVAGGVGGATGGAILGATVGAPAFGIGAVPGALIFGGVGGVGGCVVGGFLIPPRAPGAPPANPIGVAGACVAAPARPQAQPIAAPRPVPPPVVVAVVATVAVTATTLWVWDAVEDLFEAGGGGPPPRIDDPPRDVRPPRNPLCEFYYDWCLWGNACGFRPVANPEQYWVRNAPCAACRAICLETNVWPWNQCPIGNADDVLFRDARGPLNGLDFDWPGGHVPPERNPDGTWNCLQRLPG